MQQFLHDLSLYSVAHIVPAILSLGALMLFTRTFNPSMFGRYSLSLAVAGIISTLLYGWLNYSVLRYAPQLDEEVVIRNTFSLYIGITLVLLVVAGGGYLLFSDRLGPYAVFYFAALALALARGGLQVLLSFFRSVLDSQRVTLFRLVRAVVEVGLAIVLAVFVLDHIVGWVWAAAIGMTVACALAFATSKQLRAAPLFDRETVGRLFSYGVPMVGFIIGDAFLVQADRVLLEVLAGSAAVGIYSSNYMLVDRGLRLVYTPLTNAISPIIIDSWEEDNEREIADLLNTFTRYFALLGIPALVGVAVLSQTVSTLLIGDDFTAGYVVIPLVAVGLFLWSLGNLVQVVVEIKEKTGLLSYGIITIIGLNIALNVPLITAFGYPGAAVATMVSYGLYCAFALVLSKRYISWRFPRVSLRNAVLSGMLMALPTVALYATGSYSVPASFVTAAAGSALYFAVLYVIGEIDQTEVVKLRQFVA
ncbi:oligosaccharide flippase family protein [Halomicroarcula sp. S3CR25-11]|uniref:Oligosaccharide flippase family protein n=1 Tax=Haloarcula onubensis TaxID=2950539 RepID=A0ABU2FJ34_9EURY|nr:oligosaccharide flippase family protein [Halomicroarcula sp. S3CR25-11]